MHSGECYTLDRQMMWYIGETEAGDTLVKQNPGYIGETEELAIHWHQNLSGAQQSHSRQILSYLPLPQSSIFFFFGSIKKNIPGGY